MSTISIAIDGPAGAGKSTIAKELAKKRSMIYVDTGAMYRAMALYFIKHQIKADDIVSIEKVCDKIDVSISYEAEEQIVWLNGENVNALIRTPEVGAMASATSVYEKVRTKLVELQRELAKKANVVMDGRDIGTCVLPNADVKIFLTASVDIRAERRFQELTAKGMICELEELKKEISERDYRDMNRKLSPLKKAEDAIELDTSDMTIDEVVLKMNEIIRQKIN